jgi:hypothetical protein
VAVQQRCERDLGAVASLQALGRDRLHVTREPTQTLAALVLVIDASSGHGSEHLPER